MRVYLSIFLALGLSACSDRGAKQQVMKATIEVYASNYPLVYFAESMAGNLVELRFDVPPDVDPAYWNPTDTHVSIMQNADLFLMNGASYEKWAEHISLPTSTLVDTSQDFSSRLIKIKGSVPHSHGDGKVHTHDGIANLTWLDMSQAGIQAVAVRDALVKLIPASSEVIRRNADVLLADIESLDRELFETAKLIGETPLLASHPIYQYLSRRYGLNIKALSWDAGVIPTEADLLELDVVLEEHSASHLIWEAMPPPEAVRILEQSGIHSVLFRPCANRPSEGDWLTVMKENVANLRKIPRELSYEKAE